MVLILKQYYILQNQIAQKNIKLKTNLKMQVQNGTRSKSTQSNLRTA